MTHHSALPISIAFAVALILLYLLQQLDKLNLKIVPSFAPGGWCFCLRSNHWAIFFGWTYRRFAKEVKQVRPQASIRAGFMLFRIKF